MTGTRKHRWLRVGRWPFVAAIGGGIATAAVLVTAGSAVSTSPPTLTKTPSDPTTSTRAHFRYTHAQRAAGFRCGLDAGGGEAGYRACGDDATYSELTLGPHRFCVEAVAEAGRTSAPTCFSWTIVAAASAPFTITGAGRGVFYPGGPPVPVDLVLSNPNRTAITVASVTTGIAGTSSAGCSAANFAVVQQLRATPSLPAGGTMSLSTLGIPVAEWPQLRMLDTGNQDACRGASVRLEFTGTATR